jgi:hypothetical protein
MSTSPRTRTLPLLAALGVLAFTGSTSLPARADGLSIDKLPQGTLPKSTAGRPDPTAKPPTPPDSIAATEHVDGIFPSVETEYTGNRKGVKPRYRYVYVFAADPKKSASETDADPSTRVCFVNQFQTSESLTFYQFMGGPGAVQQQQMMHRQAASAPGTHVAVPTKAPGHDVRPIHIERLSSQGDEATLEASDAWLDLDTLGARLVGSTTAKFAKVSGGPNGFTLFGMREPSGGVVDFVVSAPQAPALDPKVGGARALDGIARRMEGELPGGSMLNSSCGHVRFTMSTKPGLGDVATVVANAFLPPAADDDDDVPSGMEGMSKEFIDRMREHTQRTRPVALDVSISQLASESAPLLSVTFGWAGKDQLQRF